MPSLKLNRKFTTLSKEKRLYKCSKPIIGLTGGIATGKSTVSLKLKHQNFEIIDADKLVKNIYQKEETIEFIKKKASSCIENQSVNFAKLRQIFFNDKELKNQIENFIYNRLEGAFNNELQKTSNSFIIYDAALLFEKYIHHKVDFTVCVYCSRQKQIERLLQRDKIDLSLANKILKQQMDIEEKIKLCDYKIDNSGTINTLDVKIQQLIDFLTL
ncbi:MAG: dephospho-CoA kinase [Bacteriovoracaceae bacterium]|jgi:dephospho-CoA kinase|nr:dephospho-CoA kinase [Bacteriovoracaceae bacterium]